MAVNAEIASCFDRTVTGRQPMLAERGQHGITGGGRHGGAGNRSLQRSSSHAPSPHRDANREQPGSVLKAPAASGLRHCYVIDADNVRRGAIHRILAGRPNMTVRAYRTRERFLAASDLLDPGCVVLFGQGRNDGVVRFIRQLRQTERFACVVLAGVEDMRMAIEAMKAGAVDCLFYPCDAAEILSSVDEALEHNRRMTEESAGMIEAQRQIERLTSREKDVLQGLLHGKSNKMIAIDLRISPRTVEIYRAHLMEKLGTHSLSETLRIAFAAGMD